MKIKELDEDLSIYKCTKCNHEHNDLEDLKEFKMCRAGRDMRNDGCNGVDFIQGNYWYSPKNCWHFVPVPKGANWDKVQDAYIARYYKNN